MLQQREHVAYGAIQPDQCGPRDDVMSDVEFDDLFDFRNRANVAIGEAMTGKHLKVSGNSEFRSAA